MIRLRDIKDSLLHLVFPHVCKGCGSDILPALNHLCLQCRSSLPETGFEKNPGNPVEKIFWGRLPLVHATAQFHFTKASLVRHLLHQFKYNSEKELGHELGRIMGQQLLSSGILPDALVPLPLFPAKEKKRGFNQATVLCEGIACYLRIPILDQVIGRAAFTETQTKKGRWERWSNMEGKFVLRNPGPAQHRHIMLIDDVITTGATLEACGTELLKIPGMRLSIGALCIASH